MRGWKCYIMIIFAGVELSGGEIVRGWKCYIMVIFAGVELLGGAIVRGFLSKGDGNFKRHFEF